MKKHKIIFKKLKINLKNPKMFSKYLKIINQTLSHPNPIKIILKSAQSNLIWTECDEMRHSAYGIPNEWKKFSFTIEREYFHYFYFEISMRHYGIIQLLLLIPNQNSLRVHAKLLPQKNFKEKKLNFSSFTFIFICNSTETHFKGLLKREQKRLKKEYDEEIGENFCGLKDVSRGLNYAHTRFCI